jgi:hypothetical protein
MATFQKFQPFAKAMAEKKHNLASDTLRVLLTANAPNVAWETRSQITGQLATGGGYTLNGDVLPFTSSTQTSGTYKLVTGDITWTGSGAGFGPFRYAVVYNDTATNDELIGFFDYGSSISVQTGETFVFDCDPSTGLLTLA